MNINETFIRKLVKSIIKEELNENRIFTGKEVNRHIKNITPYSEDLPTYFMNNLIKNRNFVVKEVNLHDLLKSDESFKEYYESGDERYDEYSDEIDRGSLYNELVIVDGELLDGYSRASALLRNGNDTAYAFVAIEDPNEIQEAFKRIQPKLFGNIISENYQFTISEAEYKGKKVKLNKPFREASGGKKFAVYVKTPSGRVKKVRFGAQGYRVRNSNKKAASSFKKRHKCDQKKDKTTPGYWSCNISRYRKALGISSASQW